LRKTFANIQVELNTQKSGMSEQEKLFLQTHQKLMSELKDPFL
jgi:hypothetical protein